MQPQPIKKPEQVQLLVTLPEVDLILSSMGQRPFDQVCDLIGNIRRQVVEQIQQFNAPNDDQKKGDQQ